MLRPTLLTVGLLGAFSLIGVVGMGAMVGDEEGGIEGAIVVDAAAVAADFQQEHPGCGFYREGERIVRVFGAAFSHGATPEASAEQFLTRFSGLWGVPKADLSPVAPGEDGQHLQPIMYDQATGQYKFTGVVYTQVRDGVPVFGSRLVALARNEEQFPLVLASADLRDLGQFQVNAAVANKPNTAAATAAATKWIGEGTQFSAPRLVIWAGVDDLVVPPVLATEFIAEGGDYAAGTYQKLRLIADAATGRIMYQENLVVEATLSGNVSGLATTGIGAGVCAPPAVQPMAYSRVVVNGSDVYADANGNFAAEVTGTATVDSGVGGLYFTVNNQFPPASSLSQNVAPPGPANFVHNSSDTNEYTRAEVDVYIGANTVRNFALTTNPQYPVIGGQTGFTVNVNIDNSCNAFYNGNSINFYRSGGNCNNTGYSTVVYHEYGHHLVQTGGSGQGAYGEGMADCVSMLIPDDPCLGPGFNNCFTCLRNANNTCQYQTTGCSSCGSEIHACGRLISGCVWSTRTELAATNPSTYRDIIAALTLNSILLHNGSQITPAITVDFLTLDDDNGEIADGTPHYNEIAAGFGAHNMPAPPLAPLKFEYPNGRPTFISPSGGTTMRVNVLPLSGTPQPGSGELHLDSGSGFVTSAMTEVAPNQYDAVFPALACGTQIKYYVSARATTNQVVNSPASAPASTFAAISAAGLGATVFDDNFETNQGWSVTNSPGLADGQWERGIPVDCNRGDPPTDADGSSQCYLTRNNPANCNSDVDGGSTTLTSPVMDASNGACLLSYWRWYSNTEGASPQADVFTVEISSNAGASWQTLEIVGPTTNSANPEVDGGWFHKTFSLSTIPGFTPNNQFRIRFTASDLGNGSLVEAAVDGVQLVNLNCNPNTPGDVNGDGVVNFDDVLAMLAAWGPCAGCPEDVNGDGVVNFDDVLVALSNWG